MDFTFKGFQPGLPIIMYVLILLVSVGLAWWSYREYKTINPLSRYGLISLRSTVFFILLLLLMNPLFESTNTHTIPPNVTVLLDNSRSIDIEKGRYTGPDSYEKVVDQLNFEDRTNANISSYAVGEDISRVRSDTLDYSATETNLFAAFDHLKQNAADTDAAILLSDGIYTTGQDPSYLAKTLDIPLYVVGLGDTVDVNDLIVKEVVASNEGYTKTRHPVEATIINDGFTGENITVQLRSGDQVIASETLTPENPKSAHTIEFNIPLEEEGLHQYTVHIPEKSGEWTDANNDRSFSINVRSKRDRVLHLAFEIHPDVKALRSVLTTGENISLTSRSWIGQNRFIGGTLPSQADTLDLIILHGYPTGDISQALHKKIASLSEDVPLLFVRTPQQQMEALPSPMGELLPVNVSSSTSSLSSSFYPASKQKSHPVMELPSVEYDNLPMIKAPIQDVALSAGSTALFNISYQGTETEVPFVAVKQIGNRRTGVINGFDFYKIRQQNETTHKNFIADLIHNVVTWTAADTDDQLLKVEPSQQLFDGNEEIQLDAFLKNESGESEANASVDIRISDEKDAIQEKQYTMKNKGDGRYSLRIGTMPDGLYKFSATAQKEDRVIDTYEGEFSVAPTRIEYVNTTRNDAFLKQAAEQSDGRFYDFSKVTSLWRDMKNDGVLQQNKVQETSTYYPYRHIAWFIIVVLLLGAEWLLRKYYALP